MTTKSQHVWWWVTAVSVVLDCLVVALSAPNRGFFFGLAVVKTLWLIYQRNYLDSLDKGEQ